MLTRVSQDRFLVPDIDEQGICDIRFESVGDHRRGEQDIVGERCSLYQRKLKITCSDYKYVLHLFILSLAVSLPVDFADYELRGVIQRDVDPSYVFSDQPQHEHDHSADEQDNGH